MYAATNSANCLDDGQLVKCQIKISLTSTIEKDDFDQVFLCQSPVAYDGTAQLV